MDKLAALSKGTQLMLAASVLLLIDTFLNWQSVDIGPVSVGRSAWHGFWGVTLGLLTIAAIAWIVVRVVQPQLLESIPVPQRTVALGLGALVLAFAVLKNLIDDYSAWPSYVGMVLAGGVAYGAWMLAREPEPAAASPPATAPPAPEAPSPGAEPTWAAPEPPPAPEEPSAPSDRQDTPPDEQR